MRIIKYFERKVNVLIKLMKGTGLKSLKSTFVHLPAMLLILCCCILFSSCDAPEEQVNNPIETSESFNTTEVASVTTTTQITTAVTQPEKVTFPICGKVNLSNQYDWLNILFRLLRLWAS